MKIKDFILYSLGIYDNVEYLDDIMKNFHIKEISSEIKDLISTSNRNLGNTLAYEIFNEIINKACEELELDEDKFTYYINGSLDTNFYYDGQTITCWEELEEISNNKY